VTRPPIIRACSADFVDVDLFAGGGGASEGKRRATGRSPDIAVNHWPAAIAMHAANHPDSEHLLEDVRAVVPLQATRGRRVRHLHASPTCTDFSRAKGARLSPETIAIRGLAWCILPWIEQTRPEVITLENVVEFASWGPVCWDHVDGCPGAADESGKSCVKSCNYGRPIKERRGETYAEWEAAIRAHGYSFEARVLEAWRFGAPTTRARLYIGMRVDGQPFAWPSPTHARPEDVARTGLKPWRTAAEIIDWSIPCPSIFDRVRPHVPATRRRLARGMRKFVLEAAEPFLLHLTHGDRHAPHSIDTPVPTVTGANRGEQAVAVPYMIHRSNGERRGQEPRVYDVRAPHPTAVAGGIKTAPVLAFLAKHYSERSTGGWNGGSPLDKPIGATTAQDHHGLVAAHTVKFYGTSTGQPAETPLHAVTGGGWKHGVVAASLLRYNGQSVGQRPDAPIGTLDANDRYALAECAATEWSDEIAAKARRVYRFLVEEGIDGPWLDHEAQIVRLPGTPLVIWDIGMRMLVPRELFRANGFTDDYVIDLAGPNGKRLTKTELVRLAGNVVCPDVAEALVRAALSGPAPGSAPAQLLEAA
jgi:DNA (cytosine-5)-methyltransferase 1